MAKFWARSGAVGGTGLVALGSGLQFVVPVGFEAFVQGFKYSNDGTALTKTASNNGSTLPRLDQLVLKLDRAANTVTAVIKQGAPAASPSLPSLTTTSGSSGVWEVPLCYATCPGSGSAQNYSGLTWNGPFTDYSFQSGGSNARPSIKAELQRSDGALLINPTTTDLRVWNPIARKYRTPTEGGWITNYAGRGLSHPRHGLWEIEVRLPTALAGARYIELQMTQDNALTTDEVTVLGADTASSGFGLVSAKTEQWVPENEQLRLLFGSYNSAAQTDIRAGAWVRATWKGYE